MELYGLSLTMGWKRKVSEVFLVIMGLFLIECFGYDCVFGFSTGHVGTGTISSKASYKSVNHVEFLFEGRSERTSEWTGLTFKQYHSRGGMTESDEVEFVRDTLAPMFNKLSASHKTTVMFDIGHADLFYYRGIARYFLTQKHAVPFCNALRFVRVRRERYETAQSLVYGMGGNMKLNLCDSVTYGYCPHMNTHAVMLHPPSAAVWKRFSVFQQMLWFTDETEARWLTLRQQYNTSNIQFSEVYWSSANDSLHQCVDEIKEFIGAGGGSTGPLKVTHVHAKQYHQNKKQHDEWISARKVHMEEDEGYRKAMCVDRRTCNMLARVLNTSSYIE